MKICSKCHLEKENQEFSKRSNGLQYHCKSCMKARSRRFYIENKEDCIQKSLQRTKDMQSLIRECKQVACMDCGVMYPYYVMDFDHLHSKEFTIGESLRVVGMNQLKKEIEKCEVVCANCHRIRTFKRKNPGE